MTRCPLFANGGFAVPTGLKSSPDDFDLRMSEEARPFYEQVVDFLERVVDPMQKQFFKDCLLYTSDAADE